MSLSIPEFPSNAVDGEHPRHLEAGNHVILISENLPLLVADHRPETSDLELGGQCLRRHRPEISAGEWKDVMPPILVDDGGADVQVAPRKPLAEVIRVVDLGAALVPRLI